MPGEWASLPVELCRIIIEDALSEFPFSDVATQLRTGGYDTCAIDQPQLSSLTLVSLEWALEVRKARFALAAVQGVDRLKSFWNCFSGLPYVGRLPISRIINKFCLDLHSPKAHWKRSDNRYLKQKVRVLLTVW
jgi:hypothetical protein